MSNLWPGSPSSGVEFNPGLMESTAHGVWESGAGRLASGAQFMSRLRFGKAAPGEIGPSGAGGPRCHRLEGWAKAGPAGAAGTASPSGRASSPRA